MMKFDTAFLRSKVARRIFVLFVLCALLPTGALAVLSFHHVTRQLNEQSQRRLYQAGKAVGMGIYERVRYLEAEMRAVTYNVSGGLGTNTDALAEGFVERPEERFKGIELVTDAGGHTPLFGHIPNPPEPTRDEMEHIISGKTVLSSQFRLQVPSRMFMMRTVDPENPGAGFFLGEIDTAFLWGIGHMNTLPPMTDLIVLDQSNNILISSLPGHVPLPAQVATKMNDSIPRQFEWRHEDKEYLATCWTIFLKARFSAPNWTVVLSQSKADVLAPMANFKKIFPLVILLSLWVVLLLSVIHIRRSLVPLERLKEGTQRIAMRDFDSRVRVTSGDEFEELAASFNAMSDQLQRQFSALTTIGEIDRAILSSLDIENIVDTVLTRMQDVFTCDAVCVSLTDSNKSNTARAYVGNGNPGNEKRVEVIELKPAEVQKLRDNPQRLFIHVDKDPPHYLEPLVKDGIKSFLVMPIFLRERLSGIITLGYLHSPEMSEEDLVQARQLADQVAVALSNAQLIKELKQLNWGTLTALARAVDAKSPWTAGHSERVTNLALKIGEVLGLAQKELKVLHRAGLLHDAGKIGVPAAILDKPGKLTDEEYSIVKRHPRAGVRILEPIRAYADVVPIVLQHHERFDGKGYPDGLSGEAICLGARILAVADVFDALISDRPYRAGWDRKHALELIKQEAGHQFDPNVVEAFLAVVAQEGKALEVQAMYVRPPDTAGIMEQHR